MFATNMKDITVERTCCWAAFVPSVQQACRLDFKMDLYSPGDANNRPCQRARRGVFWVAVAHRGLQTSWCTIILIQKKEPWQRVWATSCSTSSSELIPAFTCRGSMGGDGRCQWCWIHSPACTSRFTMMEIYKTEAGQVQVRNQSSVLCRCRSSGL